MTSTLPLLAALALPIDMAAAQSSDSTYVRALALELPRLTARGRPLLSRTRAARGRSPAGARTVRNLLIDSIGAQPAELVLLVLSERDWARATELPYGLHTLFTDPPVFLAPAQVDRGIYHDPELAAAEAELQVDLIGLHYFAHFFSAEAPYEDGHLADPPVKWLDELLTTMIADLLTGAIDPELHAAGGTGDAEALRLEAPRAQHALEEGVAGPAALAKGPFPFLSAARELRPLAHYLAAPGGSLNRVFGFDMPFTSRREATEAFRPELTGFLESQGIESALLDSETDEDALLFIRESRPATLVPDLSSPSRSYRSQSRFDERLHQRGAGAQTCGFR